MKIVYSPGGQLCNKMWAYVYLIAHSFKRNGKIFILNFEEYMHLFPHLKAYQHIRFVKMNSRYSHIIFNICRIAQKITNFVIDGWQYRSKIAFLNGDFEKIQFLFQPYPCVKQKCETFISEIKNKGMIVVGIHIRRGDYAEFMNGKYYFENDAYLHFMRQIQQEIGKRVCFFISSTENISFHDPEITCFQLPQSSNIEDLYALSLCDYILGPPSTFSMWASFYGKKPLRIVSRKDEAISLHEFKIIAAVDTFQDGTVFDHNR